MTATATIDPATTGATVPRRLLIGASGSIAVLALPTYLNAFRSAGVERITVVLTPAAERFLAAATLRLITEAVCTDAEQGPGHVRLARWADRVLVVPATANLLGCAAAGLAPSLLTTVLLAVDGAVVFAPAMNPVMWRAAPVRRNVAQLRADGHVVADPVVGTAYEVASQALVTSLVLPPPEDLLGLLSPVPAGGSAGAGMAAAGGAAS
jgi:phosphopantothenoylcysteine decarboxylase/phosphopantothenate--cysteine ligase